MKRRGFLGVLFGAPAVAVAGKAIAEIKEVPKIAEAVVESEPSPAVVERVYRNGGDFETMFSASASCVSIVQFSDIYRK